MHLNLSFDEIHPNILGDLEFADQRRYVIRAMVPEGYESYFQEQARYISAHTSTAIEGNPMSEEDAMRILAERSHPESPDEIEKVNLEEAYEFIAQIAADKSTRVDQGLIRTLNSIAQKGLPDPKARNRGKYRVGPSFIIDSETRAIRYRPPPAEQVPELMGELVNDINHWSERHPGPIAAALAHFGLISIHPFDDGNGRTARLVADMILDLTGWSVESMLSVSQAILANHQGYIKALRDAQGEVFKPEVEVTPFIRFHTQALAHSAASLEEKVVAFRRRRDDYIKSTDGILNERQVTALMFMLDIGPISSSVYARLTKSSQSSAWADLGGMLEAEVAVRRGAGRNTRYTVNPELVRRIAEMDREGDQSE